MVKSLKVEKIKRGIWIAWFVEMGGSPVSEIGGETYESVYRSWFVFPGLSQEKLNELGEDDV